MKLQISSDQGARRAARRQRQGLADGARPVTLGVHVGTASHPQNGPRVLLPPARVASVDTYVDAPKVSVNAANASTKKLSWEPSGQPSSAVHGPVLTGRPAPLGASIDADTGAINFALFTSSAHSVNLCLFTEADLLAGRVTHEVPLDPTVNRTGDVWHVMLPGVRDDMLYGYRVDGLHQDQDKDSPGHRHDASQIVLDPYARAVYSRRRWGQMGPDLPYGDPSVLGLMPTWPQAAGALPSTSSSGRSSFDWEGDRPLNLPMESLVIYEAHVRGFTAHPTSGVAAPGTYAGMVEKLDYLQSLGVNAIELLPVFEFNELEYYSPIAGSDQFRFNFWGYSTVNYFSPMARFSAGVAGGAPVRATCDEFKLLVRECHKRGIEVLLDVVFNHTAEGNDRGPTISFRGLDNRVYYMLAPGGEYYNYSGCGNTLNCNQPVVRQFILDCLRYWVTEYHVDGFRFDLASILTRAPSAWHPQQYDEATGERVAMASGGAIVSAEGIMTDGAGVPTGTPLSDPPLVEAISEDPVLRNTKLIAEAWDCDGLNQVGAFPHYGGRWSEWNGKFRDVVRNFIKGTDGPWAGDFASAICGSPNIYGNAQPHETDWWGNNGGRKWRGNRGPPASINFVTAHDGFTLADLVSYNAKHNEANGEDNRDGEQHNNSWNCGDEGPSSKWEVNRLRQRQMRNMVSALLLSCGVPMINMGDEYGHSKAGNNNTYCHDSELNYVRWDQAESDPAGFHRFMRLLINFRRATPALQRTAYVTERDVQWHGELPHQPDWTDTSRLVAFTLSDGAGGGLYVAFNTSHLPRLLKLPLWGGRVWQPLVDTSKVAPYDFLAADGVLSAEDVAAARRAQAMWTADHTMPVLPWSCVVLISAPEEPASTNMIRRATSGASAAPRAAGPRDPMNWATNLISGKPPPTPLTPQQQQAPRSTGYGGGAVGAAGASSSSSSKHGGTDSGSTNGASSGAVRTFLGSLGRGAAAAASNGNGNGNGNGRATTSSSTNGSHAVPKAYSTGTSSARPAPKPAAPSASSNGGSSPSSSFPSPRMGNLKANWRSLIEGGSGAPAEDEGHGRQARGHAARGRHVAPEYEGLTDQEIEALERAKRENAELRKRLGLPPLEI